MVPHSTDLLNEPISLIAATNSSEQPIDIESETGSKPVFWVDWWLDPTYLLILKLSLFFLRTSLPIEDREGIRYRLDEKKVHQPKLSKNKEKHLKFREISDNIFNLSFFGLLHKWCGVPGRLEPDSPKRLGLTKLGSTFIGTDFDLWYPTWLDNS